MNPGGSSSSKLVRNAVEKNRRVQMNDLYSTLASLIPNQPSQEGMPLRTMLEQATNYVVQLEKNVEELKQRKALLLHGDYHHEGGRSKDDEKPVLSLRDTGSTLEVTLVSGLNKNSMLQQVISVLVEEGAEVVSVSYSTMEERTFYTIHSQALYTRIGIDTSRVQERLKNLACLITQ